LWAYRAGWGGFLWLDKGKPVAARREGPEESSFQNGQKAIPKRSLDRKPSLSGLVGREHRATI
jgi:hypothetical protein